MVGLLVCVRILAFATLIQRCVEFVFRALRLFAFSGLTAVWHEVFHELVDCDFVVTLEDCFVFEQKTQLFPGEG